MDSIYPDILSILQTVGQLIYVSQLKTKDQDFAEKISLYKNF